MIILIYAHVAFPQPWWIVARALLVVPAHVHLPIIMELPIARELRARVARAIRVGSGE